MIDFAKIGAWARALVKNMPNIEAVIAAIPSAGKVIKLLLGLLLLANTWVIIGVLALGFSGKLLRDRWIAEGYAQGRAAWPAVVCQAWAPPPVPVCPKPIAKPIAKPVQRPVQGYRSTRSGS